MANKEDKRRKLSEDYDGEASFYHKYNYLLIKKYLINKKVLDVGCWSGQFASLVNQTTAIYGIDPGLQAISYAKKLVPRGIFKVAHAQKIPFKDNFFDVVSFCDVIEHLPKGDELTALKEINRVLKNKGILLISTPNNNIISILFDPAYFLIAHRHYSYDHIKEMLYVSGFKIKYHSKKGGFARLISSNIEMVYKHLFRKKFMYPNWLSNLIYQEMKSEGFAQNHIIAQKIRSF